MPWEALWQWNKNTIFIRALFFLAYYLLQYNYLLEKSIYKWKSEMKIILFVFVYFISGVLAYGQVSYTGFTAAVHDPENKDWEGCTFLFDELIDSISRRDYRVRDRDYLQGSRMVFKAGGIFEGYHEALCGIGGPRTIVTRGRYKVLNKDYICFAYYGQELLKSAGEIKDTSAAKDLGLFRIHRQGEQIRLVKSDGNPELDQLNLLYSEMLSLKARELACRRDKRTVLNWQYACTDSIKTIPEIVAFIMKEEEITENYDILYTLTIDWKNLILIKVGHAYLYAMWKKEEGPMSVVLFKDAF